MDEENPKEGRLSGCLGSIFSVAVGIGLLWLAVLFLLRISERGKLSLEPYQNKIYWDTYTLWFFRSDRSEVKWFSYMSGSPMDGWKIKQAGKWVPISFEEDDIEYPEYSRP